ncbi:common central domain of tyrosinase-domain-containing protein [Melanogaster broomeanus]|nr:common central domain of tyrosinase-domain-containing protein [Melanogaster broomeanus]
MFPGLFYPTVGLAWGVDPPYPRPSLDSRQTNSVPWSHINHPSIQPSLSWKSQASTASLTASMRVIAGIQMRRDQTLATDDKKDTDPIVSRFGGYCHHASVTFPAWHRPYVMLAEQVIGEYAVDIALQIESSNCGKSTFGFLQQRNFASHTGIGQTPRSKTTDSLALFYSEDSRTSLDDFQNVERNGVTAWYKDWPRTFRHAANSPDPPGSNIQELQDDLKAQAADLRTKVGLLFMFPDNEDSSSCTYDEFSNTLNESRRIMDFSNEGSMEGVHNSLHSVIGGNGHMSNPDYAGFDPIFFFHHSNVDRLIALWEWCYPQYWMNDGYTHGGQSYPWTQTRGTFDRVYNSALDPTGENGVLAPFKHEDGCYWTNDETRFLTTDANTYPKYYSYTEFQGVKVDIAAPSAKERRTARARIARYYGIDPKQSRETVRAPSWAHLPVPHADDARARLPEKFTPLSAYRHFIVLVRIPEYAFGCTYSLRLYHGATQLVGTVSVFARDNDSPCAGCKLRRDNGSIVRGVIYLPPPLLDAVLADHIRSDENAMARASTLITASLTGKLVDAAGTVLASAQGGEGVEPVPAAEAASDRLQPVEVTLFSAAVAAHDEDADEPAYFFDWTRHNGLFPSGWKAVSEDAL